MAYAVALPLARTEKIVVVDSGGNGGGGGASKIPGYVTDIIATLPHTIETLTGIDVFEGMKAKRGSVSKQVSDSDTQN